MRKSITVPNIDVHSVILPTTGISIYQFIYITPHCADLLRLYYMEINTLRI